MDYAQQQAEPVQAEPVAEPEHWVITTKVGDIVGFVAPGLKKGDKVYPRPYRQAEPVVQDWDLLSETQAALWDAWAILKKLKAVQDAARALVESDPDSAADTEGEAFAAWLALVAAIDDADTLLCNFGESNAAM